VRTITKRNGFTEKFAAALRGELQPQNNAIPTKPHEPLGEILRRSAKHLVVGRPGTSAPLPRQAYGTPKDVAPSHGSKHRRVRYLEDFVADGSGYSEVHDLVAGGVGRNDVDALRLLSRAGRDGRLEDASFANARKDPWSKCKIFCAQADLIPIATADEATPVKPATPKRDLWSRTSKRQRLMMKAFRLAQSGITWDNMPKHLGITQAEARGIRRVVTSMLGRAAAKRPRDQKRGVAGRYQHAKTPRIPSNDAVILKLSA